LLTAPFSVFPLPPKTTRDSMFPPTPPGPLASPARSPLFLPPQFSAEALSCCGNCFRFFNQSQKFTLCASGQFFPLPIGTRPSLRFERFHWTPIFHAHLSDAFFLVPVRLLPEINVFSSIEDPSRYPLRFLPSFQTVPSGILMCIQFWFVVRREQLWR